MNIRRNIKSSAHLKYAYIYKKLICLQFFIVAGEGLHAQKTTFEDKSHYDETIEQTLH